MNVNGSIDCTMYPAESNDEDSTIELISAGVNKYKIKLVSHNRYLTATGTTSGSRVFWSSEESEMDTWEFQTPDKVEFDIIDGISDMFTADSSLVTKVIPAHNFNFISNRAAQGSKIEKITIHHAANNITIEGLGGMWQNKSEGASSHYGINGTQVGQYVREADIAITDGDYTSHKRSVTIETANSTLAPNWEVSDASLETLIKLVADIARRNNLGELKLPVQNANGEWVEVESTNITWHSMYAPTVCPGPYLLSKMQEIADGANAINENVKAVTYLRKQGTDKFIGVNNGVVDYVNREQAILFEINSQNELCDYNNKTSKLQMRVSDGRAVLTSSSIENIIAYMEYNVDNKINIYTTSEMSTRSVARSNSIKNTLASIYESLFFTNEDVDDLNTTESEQDRVLGYVPDELVGKIVKIRNKSDNKYLTYSSESHVGVGSQFSEADMITTQEEANDITYQLWKITKAGDTNYCLQPYNALGKAVTILGPYNNCAVYPTGMYVNDSINIHIHKLANGYAIELPFFNKFLTAELRHNHSMIYGVDDEYNYDYWEIEISKDYKQVNDWLRLYYNPQGKDIKHTVEIPNYVMKYPDSINELEFTEDNQSRFENFVQDKYSEVDSNGILWHKITSVMQNNSKETNKTEITFTDRHNWAAKEDKQSVNSTALNEVENALNLNLKDCTHIINNKYVHYNTIGDKQYYWIAVGPKVIYPNYPDELATYSSGDIYPAYNQGMLDVVLKDSVGCTYYIHCLIGDTKAHTWNNGIFQSDFSYIDYKDEVDINPEEYDKIVYQIADRNFVSSITSDGVESYNYSACVEFIGSGSLSNLNEYEIERMYFYSF